MKEVYRMVNEIMNVNEEVRIASVDLVVEINKFRKEESNLSKGKYVELQHKDFMKKIRNELKVLETLGLGGEGNISPSSYINSQNKEQPCFSLNRDGVLQMLNSESVLVRYKTIERLKELEEECKTLNIIIDNTTDENAKLERNKFRFSIKRTINTFSNCETLKLPDLYKEFSEYISTLDTDTRLSRYSSALKGVSKMIETLSGELIYVLPIAQKVQYDIKSDMETLRNRQNGGIKGYQSKQLAQKDYMIAELENKVEKLDPSPDKFICVDYHAWSVNKMYTYSNGRTVKTNGYNTWIDRFPKRQIPHMDYWVDVDFSKPIKMTMKFVVADSRLDADNLSKTFADMVFNRIYKVDDNIITSRESTITDSCDKYPDGKIYFHIQNI